MADEYTLLNIKHEKSLYLHCIKPVTFVTGFSLEKFSSALLSQGIFFNISHTTIGATAFYSFLNSKQRIPHSKKPVTFVTGFSNEKFSNVLLSQGLFFNISHTTIGATAFYSFLNSKKRIPQSKKPVTFVTGFSNEKFSNVLLDVNGFTNVVGAWMYRNDLTWAYLQHKSH